MNYFKNCKNLDEVKIRFKELAKLHHPDLGGDTATMQEINNQYGKAKKEYENNTFSGNNKYYDYDTAFNNFRAAYEAKRKKEEQAKNKNAQEAKRKKEEEAKRKKEEEAKRKKEEEAKRKKEEEAKRKKEEEANKQKAKNTSYAWGKSREHRDNLFKKSAKNWQEHQKNKGKKTDKNDITQTKIF